MGPEKNTLFIFGLGYVGQHLAQQLFTAGWQIIGTSRTPEKFAQEAEQGWIILPFSSDQPNSEIPSHFHQASHILSTIGPVDGYDPVLAAYTKEIESFTGWTGYLSATSVYPDQPQGWVDETTEPDPATERGKARLLAEQRWLEIADAEIFRIAGIYGPGRNPFAALRAGRARIVDSPGHLFNRIHQTDISQILQTAINRPQRRRILNLADMKPASQGDVICFAASLAGLAPPEPVPFEGAGLSEMGRSFYLARRMIRSAILGPQLGYVFTYPDYRAGLSALFKAGA
jgi:nucleoside-diphosphate-sugar epimerase